MTHVPGTNENWEIRKTYSKDGQITFVEWTVKWTSIDHPSVTHTSAGDTEIYPHVPVGSQDEQIIQSIIGGMGAQWDGLVQFAEDNMGYALAKIDMEVTDFTPPESLLAPLSRRQLRLGLLSNGITTAAVEAAIAAIEDPMDRAVAEIEWADASIYERDHHLIGMVGNTLGLTTEQINTMWEHALTL